MTIMNLEGRFPNVRGSIAFEGLGRSESVPPEGFAPRYDLIIQVVTKTLILYFNSRLCAVF